jgi:hypothetical protein
MFLEKTGISTHAIHGLRTGPAGSRVASHCLSHMHGLVAAMAGARGPPAGRHGRRAHVHGTPTARRSGAPARPAGSPDSRNAARRAVPLAAAIHESAVVRGRTVTRCGLRLGTALQPSPQSELSRRPSFQPSLQLPNTRTVLPPSRRPDLQPWPVGWQRSKAKATCTARRTAPRNGFIITALICSVETMCVFTL